MFTTENRAKTVAALRSGKFTQNRGALIGTNGALCCIGVAYEACVGPISHEDTFKAGNAVGLSYDEQERLIYMNDHRGKSFDEIADDLEALRV